MKAGLAAIIIMLCLPQRERWKIVAIGVALYLVDKFALPFAWLLSSPVTWLIVAALLVGYFALRRHDKEEAAS